MTPAMAYLTDVEGRWEKLETFATENPYVSLDASGQLHVAEGATFVFGGDAVDRGPSGRRVLEALLAAKKRQPTQVVLIAGNRDINKLRLRRELLGFPPRRAPAHIVAGPRANLLKWIFAHTMGARAAFAMRKEEIGADDDEEVVESFMRDVAPDGRFAEYLAHAQIAFRAGPTLFVHGAVNDESIGVIPGRAPCDDVDAWIAGLNDWFLEQVDAFRSGPPVRNTEPEYAPLVAYQAPIPGTHQNQPSVVYGRLADAHGNAHLPPAFTLERLKSAGISRLIVGHTPTGDAPSILRGDGFEVISADNSYGRLEVGSKVILEGGDLKVVSRVELDDGRRIGVHFHTHLDAQSPIGARDAETGHLVTAHVDDGRFLLFKGLPEFQVEQRAATREEIEARPLAPPRPQRCPAGPQRHHHVRRPAGAGAVGLRGAPHALQGPAGRWGAAVGGQVQTQGGLGAGGERHGGGHAAQLAEVMGGGAPAGGGPGFSSGQ